MSASAQRLQKYLASMGIASRRAIEQAIRQQMVRIDGRLAQLGDKVFGHEHIVYDNRTITPSVPCQSRLLIYHKPPDEICSHCDPQGRTTVYDSLPQDATRWLSVGRLDFTSTGLLLFTNDGRWAHRLSHPSSGLERVYMARTSEVLSTAAKQQLCRGMRIEGDWYRFSNIELQAQTKAHAWYRIGLATGKNREIRKLMSAVHVPISRLIRIQYGPIHLPRDLKKRQWRELSRSDLKPLRMVLSRQN